MEYVLLALLFINMVLGVIVLVGVKKFTQGASTKDVESLKENLIKQMMEANGKIEKKLLDELRESRRENNEIVAQNRVELNKSISGLSESIQMRMAENLQLQQTVNSNITEKINQLVEKNQVQLESIRNTVEEKLSGLQESNLQKLEENKEKTSITIQRGLYEVRETFEQKIQTFEGKLEKLTTSNEEKMKTMTATLETKLTELRNDNSKKLEEMRATVDEKLNNTLEQRLGEKFKLVSERLEQVHSGLGEMKSLATGVGDLKKVLSNVKTKGIWGEIQLGNILEQVLTPEQYVENMATKKNSSDRVEFAIKIPSKQDSKEFVYLPIDSKFPSEIYEKLVDAQDSGNVEAVKDQIKHLETRIKLDAKTIRDKYVSPPETTDFAVLFVPTESLYAEVLKIPGLMEYLQNTYRITVAGPTTMAAFLNSLQMGFRTLAIEKRSSEVWETLGKVKTEFGKFGDILEKTQKKLQEASNNMDKVATRTRVIQRNLNKVEELPVEEEDLVGLLE